MKSEQFCRGPKGCSLENGWLNCDETMARVGEPCGDPYGDTSAPKDVDGYGTLKCVSGQWQKRE